MVTLIRCALVSLLIAVSPSPASAEERHAEPSAIPSAGATTLTGKERLGRKWTDEQRIDNCNVPFDKRGPRPRPTLCPHDLTN